MRPPAEERVITLHTVDDVVDAIQRPAVRPPSGHRSARRAPVRRRPGDAGVPVTVLPDSAAASEVTTPILLAAAAPGRYGQGGCGGLDMTSIRWPAGSVTKTRGAFQAFEAARGAKPSASSRASVVS